MSASVNPSKEGARIRHRENQREGNKAFLKIVHKAFLKIVPDRESGRKTKWLAKVRRVRIVTQQETHGMLSENKKNVQQKIIN